MLISRKTYVLMLVYVTTGLANLTNQANTAVKSGTIGYLVSFFITSVFIGIPLTYMELSLGQFTKRNCLEVWTIRPCLSHIGYIVLIWQVMILFYNHAVVTYLLHYFLITLKHPIPYYSCGIWAYRNCNIVETNYTVYWVCVRGRRKWMDFCNNIYNTYPEYQYYRSTNISYHAESITYNWRIYMTSAMVLVFVFLHNFRGLSSLKWFLMPLAVFPFAGWGYMLVGSMQQKGLVEKYMEALDTQLVTFNSRGRISQVISQVVYGLGLGNGLLVSLASWGEFRTPCYVNAVLGVLLSMVFTILVVFTTAMMSCPFAYENVAKILTLPLSFTFEKVPMMLSEYNNYEMFLLLNFGTQTVLGLTTDVILSFSLIETLIKKVSTLADYQCATHVVATVLFFVLSIPFFGPFIRHTVASGYFRTMYLTSTFFLIIESIVFVIWYGFERFSEDVHFMQGIRPNKYLKVSWAVSFIILIYVVFNEMYYIMKKPRGLGDKIGFFTFLTVVLLVILVTVLRLIWAAFKSKQSVWEVLQLDPNWGPKNNLLRRSRALFTANAMTTEYIYRQYHIQASIQERQRRANIRTTIDHLPPTNRRTTLPILD